MKNKNKTFLILLILSLALLLATILENMFTQMPAALLDKKTIAIEAEIDTSEIRNKLKEAGIIPHNAKYWRRTD
ncbi:MAG: hypothetical protein P9X22_04780 [Candidatus Zapsychrus exili]|nr:hypothetical protein [Candidatus Zapsychrus exili]